MFGAQRDRLHAQYFILRGKDRRRLEANIELIHDIHRYIHTYIQSKLTLR